MKFFLDLFPIILFFVTFKFYGEVIPAEQSLCTLGYCIPGGTPGAIYAATLVAIIASFAQVAYVWFKQRRVETMHLVTLALIVVLGGATLFFQNEAFIKWKPTVVNWAFGVAFLGSQFIGKRPLVQRMMESNIQLNDAAIWQKLNLMWVLFFIVLGLANLYVAFNFSTEIWVNFKLFGLLGLTLIFVVAQAFYLTRHIVSPEEETSP